MLPAAAAAVEMRRRAAALPPPPPPTTPPTTAAPAAATIEMVHSFESSANPARPARPSPLTTGQNGMPLDLLDRLRSFPLFLSAPEAFVSAVAAQDRKSVV